MSFQWPFLSGVFITLGVVTSGGASHTIVGLIMLVVCILWILFAVLDFAILVKVVQHAVPARTASPSFPNLLLLVFF